MILLVDRLSFPLRISNAFCLACHKPSFNYVMRRKKAPDRLWKKSVRDVYHTLGRRSQEDRLTFQVLGIVPALVLMSFDGGAPMCDPSSSTVPITTSGIVVSGLLPMFHWKYPDLCDPEAHHIDLSMIADFSATSLSGGMGFDRYTPLAFSAVLRAFTARFPFWLMQKRISDSGFVVYSWFCLTCKYLLN